MLVLLFMRAISVAGPWRLSALLVLWRAFWAGFVSGWRYFAGGRAPWGARMLLLAGARTRASARGQCPAPD